MYIIMGGQAVKYLQHFFARMMLNALCSFLQTFEPFPFTLPLVTRSIILNAWYIHQCKKIIYDKKHK